MSLGIMESLFAATILKEINDNVWARDKRENGWDVGNPRPQSPNPIRKTPTRK